MVTMIHFDTLQYVKTLETSGISTKQAEAMAKAQKEVLAECLDTTLATKNDIFETQKSITALREDLTEKIYKLDIRISKMEWMLGAVAGGVATLIFKAFI